MKLRYKFLIVFGVSFEIYFNIPGEFGSKTHVLLSLILLALALIAMTIVAICHYKKNTREKRLFVYANKTPFLLRWVNIPKSAIENKIIDLYDANDEYISQKMKQKKAKRKIVKEVMTWICCIALVLGCFALAGAFALNEELYSLAIVLVLLYVLPLAIVGLAFFFALAPEKIVFDKEKVEAIKKFDELDDDIQITDYKIYAREMYLEVSANKKRVFALIDKKRLCMIDYNKKLMSKKKRILEDEQHPNMKIAYLDLYIETNIETYDIKNVDINKVMEIIRDVAVKE